MSSRSKNLGFVVELCEALGVDSSTVNFYSGYKEVLFTLPDSIIESLRDENGDLSEKYDEFCEKNSIWYDTEWECWR